MHRPGTLLFVSLAFLASCEGSSTDAGAYEGRNYTIQSSDNLFSIAKRAYGNGMLWPEIRRHNPWIQDPYQLRPGQIIYVPRLEENWSDEARTRAEALDPPAESPPAETPGDRSRGFANLPGVDGWQNVMQGVSAKTLFGLPVQQTVLFGFFGLLSHSFIQSILVWLATIFTFVKETSFRRALKAVLLTETLTFATILTVGVMAVFMVYLGSGPDELTRGGELFPALESYLQTPTGLGLATTGLLLVYTVLSLRFYPQVLRVKIGQAVPVLALAVLLPHLVGIYLVGQRIGLFPAS